MEVMKGKLGMPRGFVVDSEELEGLEIHLLVAYRQKESEKNMKKA